MYMCMLFCVCVCVCVCGWVNLSIWAHARVPRLEAHCDPPPPQNELPSLNDLLEMDPEKLSLRQMKRIQRLTSRSKIKKANNEKRKE